MTFLQVTCRNRKKIGVTRKTIRENFDYDTVSLHFLVSCGSKSVLI